MDEELARHIRALLADGRKIEAIRAVREATGQGLAEAKELVERLSSGEKPSTLSPLSAAEIARQVQVGEKIAAIKRYRAATGVGLAEAKQAVEALAGEAILARVGATDPRLESDLVTQLENGDRRAAIRLLCERTAMSRTDARLAIRTLAARHGLPAGTGCLGVVFLSLLHGSLVLAWAALGRTVE